MRIFNWMFNKQNGRQETSKPDHTTSSLACHMKIRNTHNEEFSPGPESLLSIGTFGTYDLKAANQNNSMCNNNIVEPDISDFTSEVATLMKKLENMGVERWNVSEDKFMNCATTLIDPNCEDYKHISSESEIVLCRGKDLLNESTSVLKKKSISVFIKKVFACHGGFAPVLAPELRDPLSQSRMEKLLKSLLRKKVYPQNATAMPTNKYLQRKHQEKLSIEAAAHDKGDDGEKWVKTDSEYIVLEI